MSFLPTTSSVHPACLPVPTAATAAHHTLQLPATAAGRAQPLDYSSVHPAAIQPHSDDEPASPSVSVRWQEPSRSVSHAASTAPASPLSSYASSPVHSVPASPTHAAALVTNR